MPALAFYFSRFPALSETLVRSQVRALGELGLSFLLVANRAPEMWHPGDLPLKERTHYLTPLRPLKLARAGGRLLTGAGHRLFPALAAACRLAAGSPRQLAANLRHLAGAACLWDLLVRHGVRHVHVHYAFGAADVALFLDLLGQIPYSLSIHGSDVLFDQPLLAAKLARARFVVSNCRFHIERLRRKFPELQRQRFYLIRGGVDLDSPLWSPAPIPPLPPLRLIQVARLVPVKAQDLLLEALALLARRGLPVVCRFVGDGPEKLRLKRLISQWGLSDRVTLLGARPEEEVARLYDESHVVVLSSRSEGTPMTVVEAMAKARPVVAPSLTALPEMVRPGVSGWLFRSGDALELAQKIEFFLKNPDSLEQMGTAGRARAEALFDLGKNARALRSVLAQEVPALDLQPEMPVPYE